ncbi:MAG: hypothetical protein ACKO2B_01515 [Betaproteobacteria bacterium]
MSQLIEIMKNRQSSAGACIARMLLILTLLGMLIWLLDRITPTQVVAATQTRLACVSYAPFRDSSHSPFDPKLIISRESIRSDMQQLAKITDCVRTYGLDHGLDAVPDVARELGMRVILGAWISRDPVANQIQIEKAIDLSHSHADVITLMVIGNEVLLRQELSAAQLANLLSEVKQKSLVPITYADVWEFWLRHAPILQAHVDIVAVHILPYWEDDPVHIKDAVAHVHQIYSKMEAQLGPMPVLVAETGWPAAGRPRGPAVPSTVNQNRFVRDLLSAPYPGRVQSHWAFPSLISGAEGKISLPFNLIEGFDQPWKRRLEGAMGGAWGFFSSERTQRIQFEGSVVEDLSAGWALACGLIFGCIPLVVSGLRRRKLGVMTAGDGLSDTASGAAIGAVTHSVAIMAWSLIGMLLVLQLQALLLWNQTLGEWASAGAIMALGLGLSLTAALGLQTRSEFIHHSALFSVLHFAWLCVLLEMVLALLIDGRYRPLPWATVLGPAVLLLGLSLMSDPLPRSQRYLSAGLASCTPLIMVVEGPHNIQAWLLTALLLLTATAGLVPKRFQHHPG